MRGIITAGALLLGLAASGSAFAQSYGPPPGYGPRPDYGPPPGYGPPPPSRGGGQVCAYEGGFCNFRGFAVVRYGARGRYVSREARDGIPCNNRVFGDPVYGVPKRCVID